MYKSSLRHIHDPVLLPLKVKVICLCLFFLKLPDLLSMCKEYYGLRGVKWSWATAELALASSADVKNAWRFTSSMPLPVAVRYTA